MLFNPFVSYLNLQVRSLTLAHSMGKVAFEVSQMPMQALQEPRITDAFIPADPIEAAESEGMGTAIQSAFVITRVQNEVDVDISQCVAVSAVDYDDLCNVDAEALETEVCVTETPNIRKWFSENAVAVEQDIFDDRIPNRRVYSAFGQTPNAPSAIAVLERHKQKIRAV